MNNILEVEKLKVLLGIARNDNIQDGIFQFILDDITESILNYCNTEQLPSGLINTAYRMAVDLYRCESIGNENVAIGVVTAIKEGDIQTNFNKHVDDNFKDTLMKNYYLQLNKYRRVVWK